MKRGSAKLLRLESPPAEPELVTTMSQRTLGLARPIEHACSDMLLLIANRGIFMRVVAER